MSWNLARRVRHIPERVRVRGDVSRATTVSDNMKHMCMQVTLKLISNLESMSVDDSFESLMRGLILVSDCVPIKVICLGLYPYDQDILPPIATALSYCPTKCSGSTPSVQVLAQSLAGQMFRKVESKRHTNIARGKSVVQNEIDYLGNFTNLLRCSYLCATVGVAFLNVVPVRVRSAPRRVRCASYFAEWLGNIIEIHHSFGYKVKILSMGDLASDSVKKTFGTFKGTSGKVQMAAIKNPAYVTRMNLRKRPGESPIPTSASKVEMKIIEILRATECIYPNNQYEWITYPETALQMEMKDDAIEMLTRTLGHHTVDDLSRIFITMAANIFGNANTASMAKLVPKVTPEERENFSSTERQQQPSVFAQAGGSGGGQQYGHDQGGAPRGAQVLASRNSTIVELLTDKNGEPKSQTVIIIENIIRQMSDVLEANKNSELRMDQIDEKVQTLMGRHNVDDDDLADVLAAYKDTMVTRMKDLDEAVHLIKAFPAVLEGSKGLIEKEIQPSAPLMRKPDGATLSSGMYVYMNQAGGQGQMPARQQQPQQHSIQQQTHSGTPSVFQPGHARSAPSVVGSVGGDSVADQMANPNYTKALDLFEEALGEVVGDTIPDVMMTTLYEENGEDVDLSHIITMAIAMYMDGTGADPPQENLVKLFDILDPPTIESARELANNIKDLMRSPTDLIAFLNEL
jgi:hypothetical protein